MIIIFPTTLHAVAWIRTHVTRVALNQRDRLKDALPTELLYNSISYCNFFPGEAKAFAVEAKAKAEAEQMAKKADAWKEYKEAAMVRLTASMFYFKGLYNLRGKSSFMTTEP